VLSQLPPVVGPFGTLSFDVVPEQKEAAADGSVAIGRAAQLLVTVKNGQITTSFALGFASAQARTIASPFSSKVPGAVRRPSGGIPSPFGSTGSSYLRPVGGSAIGRFVDNMRRGGRFRPPPGGFTPGSPGARGPNETALNVVPPPIPSPLSQPSSQTSEPYGGSGPWVALMGASVIGLVLVRYLAYARTVGA
jgi:hypothetical protein